MCAAAAVAALIATSGDDFARHLATATPGASASTGPNSAAIDATLPRTGALAARKEWERHVDTSVVVPVEALPATEGARRWRHVSSAVASGRAPESQLDVYSYVAAQNGNMDDAASLLEFGVVPSVQRALRAGHPLHGAAARGDVGELRRLLDEEGLDVDERAEDGTTALVAAAAAGQAAAAAFLMQRHANAEAAAHNGMKAIHVAAAQGHVEVVEALVAAAADPDARHRFAESTALHFAAEMDHVDVIERLCALGADAEAEKVTGGRPLHVASDLGHADAVRALVRVCGASLNTRLLGDTTPLYLAAQHGHVGVVRALLERGADTDFAMPVSERMRSDVAPADSFGDVDHLQSFGFEAGNGATALHAASENGHFEVVRLLLQRGAQQRSSMEGASPLYVAAQYNRPAICALLIDFGAVVDEGLARDGATALYVAAGAGYLDVMRVLVDHGGANVDSVTHLNATPMFYAAGMGHAHAVAFLVSRGADPNIRTQDGTAPLHAAAERNAVGAVEAMLFGGAGAEAAQDVVALRREGRRIPGEGGASVVLADPNVRAGDDQTPLHVAAEGGAATVVAMLLRAGADANARVRSSGATPLSMASKAGSAEAVAMLLQAGADVRATATAYKATPLYLACQNNHGRVAGLLLDAGAAVNSRLLIGVTPLFIAVERGHARLAAMLLARGANPNLKNSDGYTPLHLAAMMDERSGLLELLLGVEGLKINVQRKGGNTPLMDAAGGNHASAVARLLRAGADAIVRNDGGDTAADIARNSRSPDALKELTSFSGQQ